MHTLAKGARQLVVHEALDTTWSLSGLYLSSLTPMTNMGAASRHTNGRQQHQNNHNTWPVLAGKVVKICGISYSTIHACVKSKQWKVASAFQMSETILQQHG